MSEAQVAAQRAKVASAAMAKASTELKNKSLFAMAAALRKEAAPYLRRKRGRLC